MVGRPVSADTTGPVWCRNDAPHREHERRNQFGGTDYCSGRPERHAPDDDDPCTCTCTHLYHAECDDVCLWYTLRRALTETLGRWVNDATADEAVDAGIMPLLMPHPRAVDAGTKPRGLLHDERERIVRGITGRAEHATFEGADFAVYAVPVYVAEEVIRG